MLEIILSILLVIFAIVTGYTINNKERLKLEERCLDLSRNCKELEDKLSYRNKLIKIQTESLIMKDEYIKEIIRVAESNTYNNVEAKLGKLKELAETAIKN